MDLVSVIIPLCNKSQYIVETLNCIKNQTWPNIEVIIIENNSSDNSYETAKKHAWNKVKVIRTQKKGASAARNIGLKVAKGKFIQFLDADDLLSPNKIESQLRMISDDFDLAFCNWVRFSSHFPKSSSHQYEIPENKAVTYTPKEFLETLYMVPVHAWLCTFRLIKRVGFWDERLTVNDDGDFSIRMIKESKKVLFVPELAYYRSDLTFSLSQKRNLKAYESKYASYLTYKLIVSEYNSSKLNNAALEKFGNLFMETYDKHIEIAEKCAQEIDHNYRFCYSSLRKASQVIASSLGIKCYLTLKKVIGL